MKKYKTNSLSNKTGQSILDVDVSESNNSQMHKELLGVRRTVTEKRVRNSFTGLKDYVLENDRKDL